MYRLIALWLVTLIVLPVCVGAQQPPVREDDDGTPVRPAVAERPREADRPSTVRRALAKPVAQIDWDDVPLSEVLEWLEGESGLNVVVAWRVLLEEGIDEDTPVTLRMRDTTVRAVLNEVLDQIGEGELLGYHGFGSTIKVATRAHFDRKLYVRVYDVADILFRAPDYEGPNLGYLFGGGTGGTGGGGIGGGLGGGGLGGGLGGGGGFGGGGFGGGGGMGGGGFGGGGLGGGGGGLGGGQGESEDDEESIEERMEELIELIRNTIEPDSWQDNGGRGTISAFGKIIVVRNTIEVHEQLGGPFAEEEL